MDQNIQLNNLCFTVDFFTDISTILKSRIKLKYRHILRLKGQNIYFLKSMVSRFTERNRIKQSEKQTDRRKTKNYWTYVRHFDYINIQNHVPKFATLLTGQYI